MLGDEIDAGVAGHQFLTLFECCFQNEGAKALFPANEKLPAAGLQRRRTVTSLMFITLLLKSVETINSVFTKAVFDTP